MYNIENILIEKIKRIFIPDSLDDGKKYDGYFYGLELLYCY